MILLTSTSDSKNINNKIKELTEELNFVSDFQNKTVKEEIDKKREKNFKKTIN